MEQEKFLLVVRRFIGPFLLISCPPLIILFIWFAVARLMGLTDEIFSWWKWAFDVCLFIFGVVVGFNYCRDEYGWFRKKNEITSICK